MPYTNSSEEIKKETGLEIGNLYYMDKSIKLYKGSDYLFDTDSFNFHLLPNIDSNSKKWEEYLNTIKNLRANLKRKELIDKEIKNNKNLKNKTFEIKYTSNGRCGGFDKKPNNFFRRIEVLEKRNGQYIRGFILNFMRFYIKNKEVNCILGEFQFDTASYNKNELKNINSNDNIAYPKTKKGQANKMRKLNDNGVCVYNPKNLGSIHDCNYKKVAEEFVAFIECIFFERYKYEIKKVLMESGYNYSKESAERAIENHIDYVKESFSKGESPDDVGIDIGFCCG